MRNKTWHSLYRAASMLAIVAVLAACQDLQIENPNAPDRERALTEPGDVMVLVQSSWDSWWWRHHRSCWPGYSLWSRSGEQTTTVGNCGAWPWGGGEPRARYNNSTTGNETGVSQTPWYGHYTDISSANEGIISVINGMEFGEDGADTPMVEAFARFTWGLNMGWISKFYDKAFIVRGEDDLEDPDTYVTRPWQEVQAAAIDNLERAADIADANSFQVPEGWFSAPLSNQQLSQLAHTYAALVMVYGARDPEQRAALDWNKVLDHVNRGITEPFAPRAESGGAPYSLYRFRIAATGTFSWRTSNWLLGPGDVSGGWQEWLNTPVSDRVRFVIESPDRRIHAEGDPQGPGTHFEFRESSVFTDSRGLYLDSHYAWAKGSDDWPTTGGYWNNNIEIFNPDEMELIRAEALYHLGQTQAAADIVNSFRARGELPPITPAGVSASADCVPRKPNGSCGDFVDALAWERGIELVGLRGIRAYFDRRGFGQLVCGTERHFPMPARELESQVMEVYSFGGEGQEGGMSEPHCIPSVGAGA